ncbi:Protein of unknown function [Pyronema omphalodes CBS 100304]|uniref:Uncharacterized protein n=1 Tax=Pyronema omphalodes (strain CBS 100304) TaxID=1076935 RepID=U4L969_PYROM|nr:Protein of unknown function [Pyronema omphalodes CBS 100304]
MDATLATTSTVSSGSTSSPSYLAINMSIPWLHKGVAKHTVMESKPILGLSPPTNESSAGVGSETRTVVLPSQPILVCVEVEETETAKRTP